MTVSPVGSQRMDQKSADRSGKRKGDPEAYGRNGAEGAKGGNGYGREIAQEQCRTEEKLAKGRGEIIGYADIVTLIMYS